MDSGLVVPSFLPTDDPIARLNKAMDFISTTFTSRYPPTKNHLRTLSNPRNQTTIQDGTVTVQTVQGRQSYEYTCSGARSNATCTGCTKPKRPRSSTWFKEKAMLAEALESGEIPTLAAFQTDDLDAFDSDCDEAPSTSAVLMANFCLYDSVAPSDVPTHDTYLDNQIIDQSVKEM
ncbi:hypothetical protein Tco_1337266 [Tanacetum coccineum]